MGGLRPFFSRYGSKWRIAAYYPRPTYFTIAEPLAGSAGYSLHYPYHQIKLFDKDPIICGTWDYLIHVSPKEIRRLPVNIEHLDDHNLTLEQKWLIGFWMHKAADWPSRIPSQWMLKYPDTSLYWGDEVKELIAQQVPCIRHWTIEQCSYEQIPDMRATWYVDAPYNNEAGEHYKYGRQGIDYQHLGGWCRSRSGQVIACENQGADWLDFRPFRIINGQRKQSTEVLWTNDGVRVEEPIPNHRDGYEAPIEATRLARGGFGLDPAVSRTYSRRAHTVRSVVVNRDGAKAHQRIIREQMAEKPDPDDHLKREASASLSNASVREITRAEAQPTIMQYEWLGNMGSAKYFIGLFFKHPVTSAEYLGGVACFGITGGSKVNQSICGAQHAKQVITLVRGACVHWAHPHAASYLVNRACDLMVGRGYNIFIAYSDVKAGEIGTVYQASGWTYVGLTGTPTIIVRNDREIDSRIIGCMTRDRSGRGKTLEEINAWADRMRAEGRIVKGHGLDQYVETMTRREAKARLIADGAVFKRGTPKHRYIHFAGDKRTVRELRKALQLQEKPYPKRGSVEGDTIGSTDGSLVRSQDPAPTTQGIDYGQRKQSVEVLWTNDGALSDRDGCWPVVEPDAILTEITQPFQLFRGDCLTVLQSLPEKSIDLVLTDLPCGVTACKWDSVLPLDKLWYEYRRVARDTTAFVFIATQPFTTQLISSCMEWFRYELVWEKPRGTNPLNAKKMPLKSHENIVVFYKKTPTYNPQMEKGVPYSAFVTKSGATIGEAYGSSKSIHAANFGTRYPKSVLKFKQERGLHPTQKPVPLMEYLIRTYSNEGDTVLDNCMGVGTTGLAAMNTKRQFIGIEFDPKFFAMAEERLGSLAGINCGSPQSPVEGLALIQRRVVDPAFLTRIAQDSFRRLGRYAFVCSHEIS